MTNEYGEYLNHKIKHSSSQQKKYYESLTDMSDFDINNEYQFANPSTNQAYVPKDLDNPARSYSYLKR